MSESAQAAARTSGPLRFWSVIMAATWFLAGLGAGYLIQRPDDEPPPYAPYAQLLQERFELSGKRRAVLNQVLVQYNRQFDEIKLQHEAATLEAMEPDLRALDSRTEQTIRETIIPPAMRSRFDELSRPQILTFEP